MTTRVNGQGYTYTIPIPSLLLWDNFEIRMKNDSSDNILDLIDFIRFELVLYCL